MIRHWATVFVVVLTGLLALSGPSGAAGVVEERLAAYRAAGAGPFDAARGETRWNEVHIDAESGKERRCGSCHTDDLTKAGEHVKTGKKIDPLAPSVNPDRLTEVKKIEKWFKRNCEWTLGRECTPQEKGDFLMFLREQ
ncbi:MAG: DUF1924 domain-containing protein [Leptospirillia bacterium]